MTGWPTFHEANYGSGTVYGTNLLSGAAADWRDVPRTQLGNAAIDDIGAVFRGANDYAVAQGYAAGLPNFHQADYGNGVVYGIFLIHHGQTEFRDVLASELGVWDRNNAPAMFRAASDYAARNGFAAAFPTFHLANTPAGLVFGLMLFNTTAVSWRDVHADYLRAYSDPATPMLVILCHPSDVVPAANSRQRWVDMFSPGGSDPSNLVKYYNDISYGQYDAGGTVITQWLSLNRTQAQISGIVNNQRSDVAELGKQAARNAGFNLGNFSQHVIGLNGTSDHGGFGNSNDVVLAFADGRPFEPTFIEHEFGHALLRGHSSSEGDGTYGNQFDIMSAMAVLNFEDPLQRLAGPGACAMTVQNLGWLHRSRVAQAGPFVPQTITLAAVNRPDIDHPLAASVSDLLGFGKSFYVEFREPTAWDAAIGTAKVLVTTRNTEGEAEILGTRPNYRGALAAGEEIELPGAFAPRVVRVESIDTAAATATIRVWSLPPSGLRNVRIASIVYNPVGPEWSGENVTIRNDTATSVDLSGWTLGDRAGHTYVLPAGTGLGGGHEVRVWTGPGTNSASDLFMGRRAAIWNNTGDTATLRNSAGTSIATYAYGNGG